MLTDRRTEVIHGSFSVDLNSLQALLNEGQIIYGEAERSVLRIKGPDARVFVQRMSTNDMGLLKKTQPLTTCFLTNKGKLVDVAGVFEEHNDELLLVSSFDQSEKLKLWLESFHFVEDFTLEEAQGLMVYYALSLNELLHPQSLKLGSISASCGLEATLSCILSEQPLAAGLSGAHMQLLLLCAHIPQAGEINETFMPQNVGLLPTVSETKGCYIGQEVIAKALTYQKNTKRMAAFLLNQEDFARAEPGMNLVDADGRNGIITTLAPLYLEPLVQGLAVVEDKISRPSPQGNHMLAQFIF